MLHRQFILTALLGVLTDFLDQEGFAAPAIRQRIAAHRNDSRLALAVWLDLLDEIQALDQDPALGLRIGSCIKTGHTGVVGYLCLSCDTLDEALLRVRRFYRLIADTTPAYIEPYSAEEVDIIWVTADGVYSLLGEATAVAGLTTFIRQLAGDIRPTQLSFVSEAPADIAPYETYFGCPVSFGQKDLRLRVPLRSLGQAIQQRDPALRQLLDQQAEALLASLPHADPLEETLQQALVRALHDGEPVLEVVARRMGIASRTLQRRLSERGHSFADVLDRTRKELAQRYLADPRLTLTEIALLLGYSEQSAFTRAYKRWTRISPRQARKNLLCT